MPIYGDFFVYFSSIRCGLFFIFGKFYDTLTSYTRLIHRNIRLFSLIFISSHIKTPLYVLPFSTSPECYRKVLASEGESKVCLCNQLARDKQMTRRVTECAPWCDRKDETSLQWREMTSAFVGGALEPKTGDFVKIYDKRDVCSASKYQQWFSSLVNAWNCLLDRWTPPLTIHPHTYFDVAHVIKTF